MGSKKRLKIGLVITMVVGCVPINIYSREWEGKGGRETERDREREREGKRKGVRERER